MAQTCHTLSRRALLGSAAAATVLPLSRARAQRPVIRLGVLNDQSGVYADDSGPTSVACVRQAVQDFGDHGFDVEVLVGDHQNKADIGASIARQWLDQQDVDVIVDVPTSSVALAVNSICKEKNKLYINTGAGTGDLTGEQCTPVTLHWSYDTYMLSRSTATQVSKLGGTKWYMLTADYVFGQQLARDAIRFAKEAGSTIVGESRYPFPSTTDFSSFLLSAQTAGANVIGLANAGSDTSNSIKQAHEFGLTKTMKIAALLLEVTDVAAIGIEDAQGLYLTATFYWDQSEGTRKLTRSVQPSMPAKQPPNMIQAGCYASTLHYLKAVTEMGVDQARDGAAVCAQMKAMPTDDNAFGKNSIRKDGLVLMPAFLYQVKTPAESKGAWDLQKLIATTPADEAWKPLSEEACALTPA